MRREFTYDTDDCFWRDDYQRAHVSKFCLEMGRDFDEVDFYWPNYDQAPWHIQCILRLDGQDKEVNFWPHKNKGQIIYEKSIEGLDNFIAELNRRAGEGDKADDFDVFEDDEWNPFE